MCLYEQKYKISLKIPSTHKLSLQAATFSLNFITNTLVLTMIVVPLGVYEALAFTLQTSLFQEIRGIKKGDTINAMSSS